MAEPVITIDPEQILYCQGCFEAGRCPPEARNNIDNFSEETFMLRQEMRRGK